MKLVQSGILIEMFKKHFPEIVEDNPTEFKASVDRKVGQFKSHKNSIGFMAGYTCGGATDACLGACYTQKGASSWRASERVKASNTWVLIKHIQNDDLQGLVSNFESLIRHSVGQFNRKVKILSKKDNKTQEEKLRLKKLLKRGPIFRWQWSGDLLHSLHAQAISILSHQHPHVTFWLYTRSFHLLNDLAGKADNLTVWLSSDEDNMEQAMIHNAMYPWTKIADMDERGEQDQDLICPELKEENPIPLEQACASCGICFSSKATHLTFPLKISKSYKKPFESELLQVFSSFREEEKVNIETLAS